MPTIVNNETAAAAATVQNAIDGLRFDTLLGPTLISLWSAAGVEGDTISFSVGTEEFLVDAESNTEAGSGVADTDRDQILFREPIDFAGKMFLRVVFGAAASLKTIINIEEVPVEVG